MSTGSTAPSRAGAAWLHFSVSDTGGGVPEERLATLFERFAPRESSGPRRFGGSGLDLAISRRLVELMGGQIGARNLPESGMEFWVVLPLGLEKTPPAPPPSAAVRSLHVVVLDGLAAARLAAAAMLTRLGVEHDVTDSLAEAVTLLHDAHEGGAAELVLLVDEAAARANSAELVRLLGQDPALAAARLVVASREPELAAASGQDFPFTAVVRKPLLRAETVLEALLKRPAPGAPRVSASRSPFEPAGEAHPPARREPRVLIVDDDEISRSVTAQLLARLGCTVERAFGGAEAIERTRRAAFDLIFMDCQMPEMDGFEATTKIRAAAGAKAPPIVALTANTSAADREKCFAVGMCDFVDKPVRKSELARVLRRWVPAEGGSAK
jgi:CheY-like chemotaxis protein